MGKKCAPRFGFREKGNLQGVAPCLAAFDAIRGTRLVCAPPIVSYWEREHTGCEIDTYKMMIPTFRYLQAGRRGRVHAGENLRSLEVDLLDVSD